MIQTIIPRFIWNIEKNDKSFVKIRPSDAEDESDTQTISLQGGARGDTIATKIKQIGDSFIILFTNGKESPRYNTTFKVGGNYQFVIQCSPSLLGEEEELLEVSLQMSQNGCSTLHQHYKIMFNYDASLAG